MISNEDGRVPNDTDKLLAILESRHGHFVIGFVSGSNRPYTVSLGGGSWYDGETLIEALQGILNGK